MTTRITRIDDDAAEKTTLKVEGTLHIEDAEVLEKTFANLRAAQNQNISIDLSGISFLDSESAAILCRLRNLGVELLGLHFFVQRVIETAETAGN